MMDIYTFHEIGNPQRKCKPIQYVITEKGCWECVSHKPHWTGYIQLTRRFKKDSLHRKAYEEEIGEIPEGLIILHSCDNPLCFNPSHLSVGTRADNMKDRDAKNRQSKGETHGTAKLTEDEVREILKDSRSQKEIAEEYGVSQPTICNIKARRRWRHIMVGKR
jgi:hypothetical protein